MDGSRFDRDKINSQGSTPLVESLSRAAEPANFFLLSILVVIVLSRRLRLIGLALADFDRPHLPIGKGNELSLDLMFESGSAMLIVLVMLLSN